jgi:hypothetical protein
MILTVFEITEAALLAKQEQPANRDIDEDAPCAEVPDYGVADQVDLLVVLDPEVLTSTQHGRGWTRQDH